VVAAWVWAFDRADSGIQDGMLRAGIFPALWRVFLPAPSYATVSSCAKVFGLSHGHLRSLSATPLPFAGCPDASGANAAEEDRRLHRPHHGHAVASHCERDCGGHRLRKALERLGRGCLQITCPMKAPGTSTRRSSLASGDHPLRGPGRGHFMACGTDRGWCENFAVFIADGSVFNTLSASGRTRDGRRRHGSSLILVAGAPASRLVSAGFVPVIAASSNTLRCAHVTLSPGRWRCAARFGTSFFGKDGFYAMAGIGVTFVLNPASVLQFQRLSPTGVRCPRARTVPVVRLIAAPMVRSPLRSTHRTGEPLSAGASTVCRKRKKLFRSGVKIHFALRVGCFVSGQRLMSPAVKNG